MAWIVRVCDTRTGNREGILPIENAPWARKLNASGVGQASFVVGDRDSAGMPGEYLTALIKRTLVFEDDGRPHATGIILDANYDRDAGTVTVAYADVNWIFGKRMVLAANAEGTQTVGIGRNNLSLGSQLAWAVDRATLGAGFELPIILPAEVSGSANRLYEGYHMPVAADVMKDLMETQYGPDVDFRPEYDATTGALRYRLIVDPPASLLVWNLTAPESGVTGLQIKTDARDMATHILATGEGSERDMLVKDAINNNTGYPAMVKVVNFGQEKDPARLKALAEGELKASSKPIEQWSFSVMLGEEYKLSELYPGAGIRAYMQGDPWKADGRYDLRLIGISGDFGPKVQLEFQPMEV